MATNGGVHPHGRGDNYTPSDAEIRLSRFTPTGVGTMVSPISRRSPSPVHPHGRGDNYRSLLRITVTDGSPPRAWGQCVRRRRLRQRKRFTPTGVGTILCGRAIKRREAVHPHGRGDNHQRRISRPTDCGSPPRAWGQSSPKRPLLRCARFTPTGVGTMKSGRCAGKPTPVHPHGRGDNVPSPASQHLLFGSPPRAWGQWVAQPAPLVLARFTPTGVGTI